MKSVFEIWIKSSAENWLNIASIFAATGVPAERNGRGRKNSNFFSAGTAAGRKNWGARADSMPKSKHILGNGILAWLGK